MNPILAALVYACGIAGLFYLDRDRRKLPSRALWLPVIYFWIIGSRAVSTWLGLSAPSGNVQLEGSPFDAAVFGVLLLAAIAVLINRRNRTLALLAANWPILLYFLYCLVSASWSEHPDVSLKRWIKGIGDVAMVLVVATDPRPVAALKRLFSRTGFLMLPTSLLFIKYWPALGRGFSPSGEPMNMGVTTNKNTLGVVLLVVSMGTLWHLILLVRDKETPNRRRYLLAHGVLLLFGLALLAMAHSATAIACFALGGGLIFATNLRAIRRRPGRIQAVCLVLVLVGVSIFFFSGANAATAIGRSSTLSGRTDIWAALIPTVPNALVGAGYESYWISQAPEALWRELSRAGWWHPEILVTEAHNGYIEVFLNLGWIGVGIISLMLVAGYRQGVAAVRVNPSVGGLMLAYVMASAVYSITEAGFRPLDPMWMFLLLALTCSTAVTAGYFGERQTRAINAGPGPAAAPGQPAMAPPRNGSTGQTSSGPTRKWAGSSVSRSGTSY